MTPRTTASRRDADRASTGARPAARPAGGRELVGRRGKGRGQSMVEFAISFPVVMFMILFGVDFGRVFVGWLSLSNAVREAANFAAINPTTWTRSDGGAQAEFARLIRAEAGDTACVLPDPVPAASFPAGYEVGSPAVVTLTCQFSFITPLMTNFFGGALNVSASASFPIRSGLLGGSGFGPGLPSFTPGTGATPAPSSPSGSTGPGVTPIPTPSQLPTPVPECFVPDLGNVNTSHATRRWTDAGFAANNLSFNPLVPPHFKIRLQSETAGDSIPCTSTMTVAP